ncbi:asparagine synthase-related protein [Streptomyces sviceus]|uniref:asparagine synthase-related protein n=1 Tax=Streptomyces sviceus TaxID=285530 RepID=UPI0036884461
MDFLILPDREEAARLLPDHLARSDDEMIRHPSGRPWLLGRWEPHELTVVTAGARRLVLLGPTRIDHSTVERVLGRARTLHGLDAVARSLPGNPYLIASMDGQVRAQGSVSTARQLFLGTVRGVPVAADRPDRLVGPTGSTVDEDGLALRLLSPQPPWPLSQRGLWSSVSVPPVGHWTALGPAGPARTVPWWSPPAPEVPLPEAAGTLRAALHDAVGVRTAGPGTVSADLSGGMDSTTLCFVAAAEGADLLTYHVEPLDRANEDARWARLAAERLTDARHLTVPSQGTSSWFDLPVSDGQLGEGPLPWHGGRTHLEGLAHTVAEHGARTHLTGLGGDELFGIMPSILWSLAHRHPLRSLPVLRRYQLLNRWGLFAMARGLTDRTGFAQAIGGAADTLTCSRPPAGRLALGWSIDPRMPPWATPDTVDTVRRLLRETAETAPVPLDPDRFRHRVLESLVMEGSTVRQLGRYTEPYGVTWEAPFLDDRVVEAALSVRVEDRAVPGRFKPLLTAAMRGLVPDALLDRPDKGEFSAEMFRGLNDNKRRLSELCADLRAADRGLVDAGALREALSRPVPDARHLGPFQNTLACESWLRTLASAPAAHSGGGSR